MLLDKMLAVISEVNDSIMPTRGLWIVGRSHERLWYGAILVRRENDQEILRQFIQTPAIPIPREGFI